MSDLALDVLEESADDDGVELFVVLAEHRFVWAEMIHDANGEVLWSQERGLKFEDRLLLFFEPGCGEKAALRYADDACKLVDLRSGDVCFRLFGWHNDQEVWDCANGSRFVFGDCGNTLGQRDYVQQPLLSFRHERPGPRWALIKTSRIDIPEHNTIVQESLVSSSTLMLI